MASLLPFPAPPQVLSLQTELHPKMRAHNVVSSLRHKRLASVNILLSASSNKRTTAFSQAQHHVALSSSKLRTVLLCGNLPTLSTYHTLFHLPCCISPVCILSCPLYPTSSILSHQPANRPHKRTGSLSRIYYSPRTLTGYWIGPDTEDGWGFAEAFVDQVL